MQTGAAFQTFAKESYSLWSDAVFIEAVMVSGVMLVDTISLSHTHTHTQTHIHPLSLSYSWIKGLTLL